MDWICWVCAKLGGRKGDLYSGDFRMIYTESKRGQNGVGILLEKRLKNRVKKIVQKSDRVLMIKIEAKPKDMVVIQVYLPQSERTEEEVEEVYEQIDELMNAEHNKDTVLIMGDFSAVVGEGREEQF